MVAKKSGTLTEFAVGFFGEVVGLTVDTAVVQAGSSQHASESRALVAAHTAAAELDWTATLDGDVRPH